MELDLYVHDLNLALEYQGEQHYKPLHWVSEIAVQKQRDEEKRLACQQVSVRLRSPDMCRLVSLWY
jgi:hypothetical protein